MNIIKFVSVALWSMCMLFLSCKKENPSLNETPATVEIFVCNSKGEPLENKTEQLVYTMKVVIQIFRKIVP